MATKVIVIGQGEIKPKLTPIKLVSYFNSSPECELLKATNSANYFNNIELIVKGYYGNSDLMFCYNSNRDNGILYLGHFNDGVVE